MDDLTERQCHDGLQLFEVFKDGEGVCVCCFLKQETLLTLLQSTQLLNGDLVAWCQLGKQPTQLRCSSLVLQILLGQG